MQIPAISPDYTRFASDIHLGEMEQPTEPEVLNSRYEGATPEEIGRALLRQPDKDRQKDDAASDQPSSTTR